MHTIQYIDRRSKKQETERVYGSQLLQFLYSDSFLSRTLGKVALETLAKWGLFSQVFGAWQKLPWTKKRIPVFIKKFDINANEFLLPIESYTSFNDFFIRKLKPEARPIAQSDTTAVIPADGRYLFYQDIQKTDGFVVKGKKFNLASLLNDNKLAEKYADGSMVIARLCPTDYHRFHFPMNCIPSKTRIINGWLYSVNPIAIKKNIDIFTENKRAITALETEKFGIVQFIEVGATNVGSIIQTFTPEKKCFKGDEKGYFSFGASSIIILFEKNKIQFDEDLLAATQKNLEILCLLGQSLGNVATFQ